jgi:hypothetical protein
MGCCSGRPNKPEPARFEDNNLTINPILMESQFPLDYKLKEASNKIDLGT